MGHGPWRLWGEGESQWLEMLNQEVSSRKAEAGPVPQLSGGFLWGWEGQDHYQISYLIRKAC